MGMGEALVAPVEVDAVRARKVAVVGPIGQVRGWAGRGHRGFV